MTKIIKKGMVIVTVSVGLMLLLSASSVWGMTAKKFINNMGRAYEEQMEEIEDMTIFRENKGGMPMLARKSTIYRKRAEVAGKTIYKTRTETEMMGRTMVTIYDGVYNWSVDPASGKVKKEKAKYDPTQIWKNLDLSETHYLGTEEIEGKKAHLLKIDNPLKVLGMPSTKILQEREASAEGKIWVNAEDWMLARTLIIMSGKFKEGKEATIRFSMDFKDYRPVDGMLLPYRMITSTKIDIPGASEKEKQMMQAFMGGMGSFEMITTEVKVNTGLSDELFDGTRLKTG
ncbi:MAG: hypothetical protein U9O41_04450 [Candidatus Aerophobetes bacterium]|nr:hypothetical protein [Candidatus Aerophobetes bacterium]